MSPYSSAQLLFLSKFRSPQSADIYADDENWREVLGEKPSKTTERFRRDGLLQDASFEQRVDIRFKSSELKEMLKTRGLKQSGRKDEQIERLIQNNRAEMEKAVSNVKGYVLSEKGAVLVNDYLTREREIRERIDAQVIDLLRKRDFEKAARTIANYESEQVFPLQWYVFSKPYNPKSQVTALQHIFSRIPALLKGIDNSKIEDLRIAAGMMLLWGLNKPGKYLPKGFTTDIILDSEVSARMFLFLGFHGRIIDGHRESKDIIEGVQILSDKNCCPACKEIHGITYKLNNVLELPYEHCTHKMGCRCTYLPLIKGFSTPF